MTVDLRAMLANLVAGAASNPRASRILGDALLATHCAKSDCPGCAARLAFAVDLERALEAPGVRYGLDSAQERPRGPD